MQYRPDRGPIIVLNLSNYMLINIIGLVAIAAVILYCHLPSDYTKVHRTSKGLASFRVEGGVKYLSLESLLMIDWDPKPEGDHDEKHYTISSIEEVGNILTQRVEAHPNELWKAYLTPSGGVHAFLLSHQTHTEEGVPIINVMQGDLLYAAMTKKRGCYGVRVSPKIVDGVPREGDYVAKYWKSFGSGTALPENEVVMALHDSFLP